MCVPTHILTNIFSSRFSWHLQLKNIHTHRLFVSFSLSRVQIYFSVSKSLFNTEALENGLHNLRDTIPYSYINV